MVGTTPCVANAQEVESWISKVDKRGEGVVDYITAVDSLAVRGSCSSGTCTIACGRIKRADLSPQTALMHHPTRR